MIDSFYRKWPTFLCLLGPTSCRTRVRPDQAACPLLAFEELSTIFPGWIRLFLTSASTGSSLVLFGPGTSSSDVGFR